MTRPKILITEDEVLVAREIEDTLQELGYQVVALAQDGESTLQQITATNPDLVLMDIVIPGEWDGIETANQIRSQFQIPVVYLTAHADPGTLERAKLSEPFGYILKPFQSSELDVAIQIALTRHNLERLKLNVLSSTISTHLSHEMNAPLGIILGCINSLISDYYTLSRENVLEMLLDAYTAAIQLNKLCQNFLLQSELERLTTNSLQRQAIRTTVTPSTATQIEQWAIAKAGEFNRIEDVQLDLQESPVQLSEFYLKRIVEELLDNALKYSETGTVVGVKSGQVGAWFCLSVSDRGCGLTPEQITTIGPYIQFHRESYEQEDYEREDCEREDCERERYGQKGLGVGLTLMKRLIELHDGELAIQSEVNNGTTVTVKLHLQIE